MIYQNQSCEVDLSLRTLPNYFSSELAFLKNYILFEC